MCLAIPGRLVEVGEREAVVDLDGVRRSISTILLEEPPEVGDWVVIHVGFAITRLDVTEAETTLALLREALRENDTRSP
ncbi:MAG: HypC/HybG/HupF family hydrogenase formation chaperone [Anaerolineales bacterium]|nr:HypC/HybG/HupF family hydrogenase formation chaperone [Anaerolineales bacterium]